VFQFADILRLLERLKREGVVADDAILEQLRTAVSDLGSDLRIDDRLRVSTFSMYVQRILDVDAAPLVTDATFATVPPAGSSAILDALAVAPAGSHRATRRAGS
jgi:hypothetical protein